MFWLVFALGMIVGIGLTLLTGVLPGPSKPEFVHIPVGNFYLTEGGVVVRHPPGPEPPTPRGAPRGHADSPSVPEPESVLRERVVDMPPPDKDALTRLR